MNLTFFYQPLFLIPLLILAGWLYFSKHKKDERKKIKDKLQEVMEIKAGYAIASKSQAGPSVKAVSQMGLIQIMLNKKLDLKIPTHIPVNMLEITDEDIFEVYSFLVQKVDFSFPFSIDNQAKKEGLPAHGLIFPTPSYMVILYKRYLPASKKTVWWRLSVDSTVSPPAHLPALSFDSLKDVLVASESYF
jgi:hypothetical protein